MPKEIIIEISPSAKVTIKAEGYADSNCAKDTRPFEDALKGKIDRKEEAAFYITPHTISGKVK